MTLRLGFVIRRDGEFAGDDGDTEPFDATDVLAGASITGGAPA